MPGDAWLVVCGLLVLGATVAALVELNRPVCRKSPAEYAWRGTQNVEMAAELELAVEDYGDRCPTLADLVASRRLDPGRVDDPWGRPYQLACPAGEPRAWSNGTDGSAGTGDDIRSDMTPTELAHAAARQERPWYHLR